MTFKRMSRANNITKVFSLFQNPSNFSQWLTKFYLANIFFNFSFGNEWNLEREKYIALLGQNLEYTFDTKLQGTIKIYLSHPWKRYTSLSQWTGGVRKLQGSLYDSFFKKLSKRNRLQSEDQKWEEENFRNNALEIPKLIFKICSIVYCELYLC